MRMVFDAQVKKSFGRLYSKTVGELVRLTPLSEGATDSPHSTAMDDIVEHPRPSRSTVMAGGVEHRVTTMVVRSEALARTEERAGHGWRRLDERFVKGTHWLEEGWLPPSQSTGPLLYLQGSQWLSNADWLAQVAALDVGEYLPIDGIPPPPSPQPPPALSSAPRPASPLATGSGVGPPKRIKRSRGSRSRSNSSTEVKRTRGRGRFGEIKEDRTARRLESQGAKGQPASVVLNVPADAMASTQLPSAPIKGQEHARSVVISKEGLHGPPPARRGRARPLTATGPIMRMTVTTNSPPQSLEQRMRALDPVTQKQWLDRMDAERTAAGLKAKDAAGGADRGSSPSVPARL